MASNSKLWIEVRVDLRWHPKVISSSKALGIPKVYFEGHLINLWSGALEYTEDGDLWRGEEERTVRFIESLAEIPDDPMRFIEVLRLDNWLEGWLIHDWLDYSGRYLIAKYKTHNRDRLVEIWRKHGRAYGRDPDHGPAPPTSHGKLVGSEGEVNVTNPNLPYTLNPNPYQEPKTLNPSAQDKEEMKNSKGGLGEKPATPADMGTAAKAGFSDLDSQGFRARGVIIANQAELTGDAVPLKPVFEVFMPLLKYHGIYSMEAFHHRIKHCKTTPSRWMMLFMDKVHAVYRDRGGTRLIEDDDADPVAMTVAGLVPRKGGHLHQPTEAARQLFLEIMLDYAKAQKGERSRWASCMSPLSITIELDRRKGKAGKIVS